MFLIVRRECPYREWKAGYEKALFMLEWFFQAFKAIVAF